MTIAQYLQFKIKKDYKRLEVKIGKAKQIEINRWSQRSDYDGVIMLKVDKPTDFDIMDDPEIGTGG